MTTQTHQDLEVVFHKLEELVADCKTKLVRANSRPNKTLADEHALGLLAGLSLLAMMTTELARIVHDIGSNPNP